MVILGSFFKTCYPIREFLAIQKVTPHTPAHHIHLHTHLHTPAYIWLISLRLRSAPMDELSDSDGEADADADGFGMLSNDDESNDGEQDEVAELGEEPHR